MATERMLATNPTLYNKNTDNPAPLVSAASDKRPSTKD